MTLLTNISRPLLKPNPVDPNFQLKKPLVQVHYHSYLDPDFALDVLEFPHDELRTPPLDSSMAETRGRPYAFVMDLRGKGPTIGNISDMTYHGSCLTGSTLLQTFLLKVLPLSEQSSFTSLLMVRNTIKPSRHVR